jgi:hypothetical protein
MRVTSSKNPGYIKIIKDCFAYKVDFYGKVIGVVRLYANEIFPKCGIYNYYRNHGEHWNTSHPEISVADIGRFEVEPECYNFTEQKADYVDNFNDRYFEINNDLDTEIVTALLLTLLIKLEINPFNMKVIENKNKNDT